MEYIIKEREQKKRMTKAVFENEEILRQLEQSEWEPGRKRHYRSA